MSRALGTLPEHVAIVGIEAFNFNHGPMSPQVAASIDDAVAAVSAELARAGHPLQGSEAGTCVWEQSRG